MRSRIEPIHKRRLRERELVEKRRRTEAAQLRAMQMQQCNTYNPAEFNNGMQQNNSWLVLNARAQQQALNHRLASSGARNAFAADPEPTPTPPEPQPLPGGVIRAAGRLIDALLWRRR